LKRPEVVAVSVAELVEEGLLEVIIFQVALADHHLKGLTIEFALKDSQRQGAGRI